MKRPTKTGNVRVVDTNVLKVANRDNGESIQMGNACARALLEIRNSGALAADRSGLILQEYRKNCRLSGQPGIGDAFVKWAHDHIGHVDRVHLVDIQPDKEHGYVEFPKHPELKGFDPADRKFIAVAQAHPEKPPILQAVDGKWWGFADAFSECGVRVVFLCPAEIAELHRKKMGS